MWEKAVKREPVFHWISALAIYFNIIFRQGQLWGSNYSKIDEDKDSKREKDLGRGNSWKRDMFKGLWLSVLNKSELKSFLESNYLIECNKTSFYISKLKFS